MKSKTIHWSKTAQENVQLPLCVVQIYMKNVLIIKHFAKKSTDRWFVVPSYKQVKLNKKFNPMNHKKKLFYHSKFTTKQVTQWRNVFKQ
jgi:hypothetical protein